MLRKHPWKTFSFLMLHVFLLVSISSAGTTRGFTGRVFGTDPLPNSVWDPEVYTPTSMGSDYLWPLTAAEFGAIYNEEGWELHRYVFSVGWKPVSAYNEDGVVYRARTCDNYSASWWQNRCSSPWPLCAITWVDEAEWFVITGMEGFVYTLTPPYGTLIERYVPTSNHIYAVDSFGLSVIGVGENGRVIVSEDGGVTWTLHTVDVTARGPGGGSAYEPGLYGIDIIDDTKAVAVGVGGIIVASGDGGINWVERSSPTSEDLFDVDYNGWKGAAVGETEHVYTEGGTVNWLMAEIEDDISLCSVKFNPATDVWYSAGEDSRVYFCESSTANEWTLLAPDPYEEYCFSLNHPITDLYYIPNVPFSGAAGRVNFVGSALPLD